MLRNEDIETLTIIRNYLRGLAPDSYAKRLDDIIQRELSKKKTMSEKANAYNKSHKEKHREQSLKSYYKRKQDKVAKNNGKND